MKDERTAAERILAREMVERFPGEAARLLEGVRPDKTVPLVETLSVTSAAALVEKLDPETAGGILQRLSPRTAGLVLGKLDPQRAASLLAGLPEGEQELLLGQVGANVAAELRSLASYPPETAGSMMDPRVFALRADTTVGKTLARLRAFRDRRVRRVHVIDDNGRLIGTVRLQEIAMARPSETLEGLMEPRTVAVHATAGREEVVDILTRTRVAGLPVVDFENRIVGIIREDALLEAAQEEASADVQTMVGVSRDERALSPVGFAVRKRLPWLEVNLGTAFLAAAVVGLFEGTIARFTALAVLLPVVAGQSGNTGAQALAVTMRGLALREIRVRHWLRVGTKEIRVAFLNGIAVALTTSVAVYLWSRSPGLSLVIGSSMVLSMVAAGAAGAGIPMVLTAIGQDPAQSSSIILTTVTDVVGFFSFLGIATLLAGIL
jgi:magnesium transporter